MNPDARAGTGSSQSSPRPIAPAYWVFLPGLLVSGWVLSTAVARANSFRTAIGLALLVFVPGLVGLVCRALGQRVATSLCAVVVVGSYWTLTSFLLFIYTRESVVGLFYIGVLFIPVVVISILATISVARRVGGEWAIGTVSIGSFCGILGAIVLLASKLADLTYARPSDPIVLAPEMITINKCSQEFARSHPEAGYSESLVQLGPQGTGCIPEVLLKGQVKEFTIVYEPGPKDANGKVASYAVKAREVLPKGPDISSMLTDESGLIRYRFDGPHGKGATYLYFPDESTFKQALSCLWDGGNNSGPWVFIDGQEKTTVTDRDEYFRRCLGESLFTGERKFSRGGYSFEYSFVTDKDGTIRGFALEARPQLYGVSGIRSYLAVGTIDRSMQHNILNVYAIPQDRPATVNDPLAQAQEIGMSGLGPLATTER